ncbi:hypothetical protein ACUR5C_00080 [Aliikangiella sp. IMCC44653]
MSSVLTATSYKSNRLYLILLALLSIGAVYWVFGKSPNKSEELVEQAFELNYVAFKNGIMLAHFQNIVLQARALKRQEMHQPFQSLHFNQAGFPVALEKGQVQQEVPFDREDCQAIWKSVLGPLQPKVSLSESIQGYWTELDTDGICQFGHGLIKNKQFFYHALSGKVTLKEIND